MPKNFEMIIPALVEILVEHPRVVRMAELLKGSGYMSRDVQAALAGVLPDNVTTDLINTLRDLESGARVDRRCDDPDFKYAIKTLKDRYRKWRGSQVASAALK